MSSCTVVRNSIDELYTEEAGILLQLLQLPKEQFIVDSDKFEAVVSDHIKYVLSIRNSWEIKEFGKGFQWLNTEEPLDFDGALRDKVVVLDFFTYCCINCDHVAPIIHGLEEKYRSNPELVVIGVHSPKHPTEREKASVANALQRNGISYPVINDADNKLWKALGINCWPTVLVVGPEGKVLFSLIGERAIQKLEVVCSLTLSALSLDATWQPVVKEAVEAPPLLRFPAGISSIGDQLLLSDTGHHRLLRMTLDGRVLDVIGSGSRGLKDGSFETCSFSSPRGSDWLGHHFALVADTENHCIRLIDFAAKQVSVLDPRGNGLFPMALGEYEAKNNEMKSPWDVCVVAGDQGCDTVYIAAAGSHQIWAFHLAVSFSTKRFLHSQYFAFAGNGAEECRNNCYRQKAGFAQPSGLCLCPGHECLCIVDSESSTLRGLSWTNGGVQTVIGGDKNRNPTELFCFGDADGVVPLAKFQHPLAVCTLTDSKVLIADTYNHKLRVVDVTKQQSTTVAGGLAEPGGVCVAEGRVFVADTNSHSLKTVDLDNGSIQTINVTFPSTSCVDGFERKSDVKRLTAKLKANGQISLKFVFNQPGFTLTEGAPQLWTVSFEGPWEWSVRCESGVVVGGPAALRLRPLRTSSRACAVLIELAFSVCCAELGTCSTRTETVALDVELSDSGSQNSLAVFYFGTGESVCT